MLGCTASQVEGDAVISDETALAMAEGARALFAADWAAAVTGETGPDTATSHPPGTVCFAWVGPEGSGTLATRLPGDRRRVQEFAAATVINLVRLAVSGLEPGAPFR